MFKNLSIRQISIYISLGVWLLNLLIVCAISYFGSSESISLGKKIIIALFSLLITYAIVRFFTEQFIFRKIKLIYKVITQSKDSLKDVPSLMTSSTSFEQVNDSVIQWAENTEAEISSLKSLKNYRQKFFGDVSHELKTPLFSIQGYLHTLVEGGVYDEKVNLKYLKRAIRNVDRLQDIVEDLEMINRLETDEQGLNITTFDIKELSEEVMSDLEFMAKEKNINLTFKPGADKTFQVSADKEKIRQVLINLITNSIKYSEDGSLVKLSFYDMEQKILVEVSDTGIGISEEDIKHVFDRFYRTDKSRNRAIGGSGLGLSIVKHIIEAHNEKINARSTDGVGSTFGFTLAKKG